MNNNYLARRSFAGQTLVGGWRLSGCRDPGVGPPALLEPRDQGSKGKPNVAGRYDWVSDRLAPTLRLENRFESERTPGNGRPNAGWLDFYHTVRWVLRKRGEGGVLGVGGFFGRQEEGGREKGGMTMTVHRDESLPMPLLSPTGDGLWTNQEPSYRGDSPSGACSVGER